MMSTLTSKQSHGIILAIVHLVNRNWEALCLLYKKLGLLSETADITPIVNVGVPTKICTYLPHERSDRDIEI